jgi:hypothetical protein
MAVHGVRLGLYTELVAALVLSVHSYRDGDTYSQRSAPLFTAKMKYGHERH